MLEFRPFQSSKVWEFTDPDTRYKFKSKTRAELVKHIITYRQQNRLEPIQQLDAVINNYLCSLPINAGSCRAVDPLTRGMTTTIKGGMLLLKSLMYDKFVGQAEADRRSAICVTCPFNVFPKKSFAVRVLDKMAGAMVGKRKSANHEKLGNCAVCSCPLRGKVFYAGEVDLTDKEVAKMKTVNCWQLELPRVE